MATTKMIQATPGAAYISHTFNPLPRELRSTLQNPYFRKPRFSFSVYDERYPRFYIIMGFMFQVLLVFNTHFARCSVCLHSSSFACYFISSTHSMFFYASNHTYFSGIICSMSHLVLLPRRGCLMPTSEEWLWDGVAIKATK
jgi:hypothetical protein